MKNTFNSRNIERIFEKKQLELDKITDKFSIRITSILQNNKIKAASLATRIDALSPLKIMARGFSVALKNDKCVTSVNTLSVGDSITVKLIDGSVDCSINDIKDKQE